MWLQKEIRLRARPRGFHLITDELLRELPELRDFRVGMMNVFLLRMIIILEGFRLYHGGAIAAVKGNACTSPDEQGAGRVTAAGGAF